MFNSLLKHKRNYLKENTIVINADIFNLSPKYYITLIFFLLIFFNSATLVANVKYSNVKIYMPEDISERLNLLGLLAVDHYHEHDGAFNYTVSEDELERLKKSGYKFEIINEDAIAYLEEENNKYFESLKNGNNLRVALEQPNQTVNNIIKTPAAFVVQSGTPNNGGYYRIGQMDTAIRALKIAYPNIVDTFTIGTSVEGRPIKCIKISDSVATDENEPEILFMGLHHAREAISGSSMIFLMQYLCENYSVDSRIKDLVDNREIFIIVCANPDGWVYNSLTNPNGGGQWRKNRKNSGSGIYGVDLNRNWGVSWADSVGAIGGISCGTGAPGYSTYWGPSKYSEPETKALRTFCRARDFAAVMDQHATGPYYSLPWGRNYNPMSGQDDEVYTQLSSVMGKYNGMRYGSTYQTLGYEVTGGMKDLLLKGDDSLPNGKCYGMTGEGSNGSSVTSFWPLASEIITLCKGMVYQDLQLIYSVGSYIDLEDIGSLNVQTKTGKFYFKARRIGLQNQSVNISVIPIQNVFSVGGIKTINTTSLPNFNDTYTDSISFNLSSGIAPGNSFKYAWKIETTGYTYYDTITAIYQPNVLFTDSMETGLATTNWTISSGWAYTTDYAYNGTKSLGESPGANYTRGVNLTAQIRNNLNLSGSGAAYLTFNLRYRCENFYDKLQVEASTDGVTWTALSGTHTIKEPGTNDGSTINGISSITGIREFWTREIFNLNTYLSATALRLRFRFTSDNNPSSTYVYDNDEGFYIDNVSVITGGTPSLLPVELLDFTGFNDDAINILNWSTASELNTKNFIIQRSVNARDYIEIGSVNAAGNSNNKKDYAFTDNQPYFGENLYRLKIVDLDGTFKYSKLVSVNVRNQVNTLTPTGIEKIFPNPSNEKTFINFFSAEESAEYNFRVFNSIGQIMFSKQTILNQGRNTLELDISNYSNGLYIISFNNETAGISYENTIIKN